MLIEVTSIAVLKEGALTIQHKIAIPYRKIVSFGNALPLIEQGFPAPEGCNTIISLEGVGGPIFVAESYELVKQAYRKVAR